MADTQRSGELTTGIFYALMAYGFWGVVPAFWKLIGHVSAGEILVHRVIWALLCGLVILRIRGQLGELGAALRSSEKRKKAAASAAILGTNWLVFIYAMNTSQVLYASLGYFINPLVSMLLGLVLLKERLRTTQWFAVALACAGIASFTVHIGTLPFISLALAGTFGAYGYARKKSTVGPIAGTVLETFAMLPFALSYLTWLLLSGAAHTRVDATLGLLSLTGLVTLLPLIWFANGARRLPLTTLGFVQYLAPTLQFLLAVVVYEEPFERGHLLAFVLIWTALAVFTLEGQWHRRRRPS